MINRSGRAPCRCSPASAVRVALLAAVPVLLAACRDARVENYRIPRENEAEATAPVETPAPAPTMAVADRPVEELVWTAPATWRPKPLSSMRRGSYDVGEDPASAADLAITAFPGAVGGDLANVNRWRGQVDLPPLGENELASALQTMSVDGLGVRLVDVTGGGPNPTRLLGAIVPLDGATWFFKLTGPAPTVAREKPRFLELLGTVRPSAPNRAVAAPAIPSSGAAVPELRWEVPAGWEMKPASPPRRATFVIAGPGGASAEVAVTTFPGNAGGELANVNRWRGQLQLPALDDTTLAGAVLRFTAHGFPVAVIDCQGGPDGSARLVGAIVPVDGATWFFKLTGPDAVVAAAKPDFLAFLHSLSPP